MVWNGLDGIGWNGIGPILVGGWLEDTSMDGIMRMDAFGSLDWIGLDWIMEWIMELVGE